MRLTVYSSQSLVALTVAPSDSKFNIHYFIHIRSIIDMPLNYRQAQLTHAEEASNTNRLSRKLDSFSDQAGRFPRTRLKRAILAPAITVLALMPVLCRSGLANPGSTLTVSLSSTSLSFGYLTVGATSAARPVSLKNASNAALAIQGIVITGSDATDFAQSNDCGSSVAVGANCTFSVTMTPTAAGSRHASLTLVDSGPGGSQTVNLTGIGMAPTVNLSPPSISFGSRPTGTTSAVQNITVSDVGPGILLITNLAIIGADATDFAQTNNCGKWVRPRRRCTIGVTFTPIASGSRVAVVTLSDNASGGTQTVSLLGIATGSPSGSGNPSAGPSLSSTSLSFGDQPIAVSSTAQTITLTNNTGAALSIAVLTIGGANAGDFAEIANSCITSQAVGGACTIAVSFTPSDAGQRTATLSITDNASNSPQTVSLTGTGCPDVILSWAASATPSVVGYNIYRGTASEGERGTPINSAPVNTTTYVDANVKAGTTYYYVLRSVAANGVQSPASNETTANVPIS